MNKILIVDDEKELLNIVSRLLEKHDYSLKKAINGQEALELLEKEEFDLLLTDIIMPNMNGIELIKQVKEKNSNLPIIVMTGEIKKNDLKLALEEGINALIEKPFDRSELLQTIKRVLSNKGAPLKDSISIADEKEFLKISIDEFIVYPMATCDVFLKFSESKFLKILKKGDALSPERIRNYKQKGVKFLFVKKIDHKKFLSENLDSIKSVKTIPNKEKHQQIKKINELIMEEIYSENMDSEIFEYSTKVAKENIDHILNQANMLAILKELEQYADDIYRHSIGVNIIATMTAKKHGWCSDTTFMKLNIAGLYHDAGKKWFSNELRKKATSEFTPSDWNEFKKHPQSAAEMLSQIPNVPEDVLDIILQHHESYSGKGYPSGLQHNSIHSLSRLLCIANDYCNYTVKQSNCPQIPHDSAMKKLEEQVNILYDPDIFKSFVKIFK